MKYTATLGAQRCENKAGVLLLSQFRLVLCEAGEQPSVNGLAVPLYQIYDEVCAGHSYIREGHFPGLWRGLLPFCCRTSGSPSSDAPTWWRTCRRRPGHGGSST